MLRIDKYIHNKLQEYKNKTFITTKSNILTYGEFQRILEQMAQKMPSVPKSLVVISCKKPINFILAYYTSLILGHIPVIIPNMLTNQELIEECKDCGLLLTDSEIIVNNSVKSYFIYNSLKCIQYHKKHIDNSLKNTCVMIPTSGTYRNRKRVALSLENIINNVYSINKILKCKDNIINLVTLPLYYSFAHTNQMWFTFINGGTLILQESNFFNPKEFINLCEQFKPNQIGLISRQVQILYEYKKQLNPFDFKYLEFIIIAGGQTGLSIFKKTADIFQNSLILQGYGLTEASPRVAMENPQDNNVIYKNVRSSGYPLECNDLKIFNETFEEMAPYQTGHIWISGSNVMQGYYSNGNLVLPLKNNWLNTGDLGFRDNKGRLYVLGRESSLIMNKGFKIFAEEIESFLLENEYIEDCLALTLNGIYTLIIETKDTINKKELIEHMRKYLAYWKIPEKIIFDQIPRTSTGKKIRCLGGK